MMEVIKEAIPAGLLGPHINDGVAAGGDDLLETQVAAFKFRNDRVKVLDVHDYRPARRSMKLGRFEFMLSHYERQRNRIVRPPGVREEQ